MDWSNPHFHDLETLLLHLRANLGVAAARWLAFDAAITVYWQRTHQNQTLDDFINRDTKLHRVAARIDLPSQVISSAALIAGVPVPGSPAKIAAEITRKIHDHSIRKSLLADCPMFSEIVTVEDPEEILPFLPALLEWDLNRLRAQGKQLQPAVFFDAWEHLQALPRMRQSAEDHLVRLMYLLPSTLFVLTGRNRVTWGDDRDDVIYYSGADLWPTLAAGSQTEPRQHLLGGLSDHDAATYLRARLTSDGKPAIPEAICQKIVQGAHGLPLYLDLSADHFEELQAREIVPQPAMFGRTFPQLVSRLLGDLEQDERDLVRTGALLSSFSEDLLRPANPGIREATLRRFVNRHFIALSDGDWAPYTLHEVLVDCIKEYDRDAPDGWSPTEWRAASDAVVQRLRSSLAEAIARPTDIEVNRLVQGFMILVRLTHFLDDGWDFCYALAYVLRLRHLPHVLEWPSGQDWLQSKDSSAVFAETCRGMALLEAEKYHQAEQALRQNLSQAWRVDPLAARFTAGRLSKATEKIGSLAKAEELVLQAGSVSTDPHHQVALKDLARARFLGGRPREAFEWATSHVHDPDPGRRDQALDLLGWVYLVEGEFARAVEYFTTALEDPELASLDINWCTASRHRALAMSLAGRTDALAMALRARQINQDAGKQIGVAQCDVAIAVATINQSQLEEIQDCLVDAERRLEAVGDSAELWLPYLARLLATLAMGKMGDQKKAYRSLSNNLTRYKYHPNLMQVINSWTGFGAVADDTACWLNRKEGLEGWQRLVDRLAGDRP